MMEPTTDFKSDLVALGLEVTEVDYNQRGFHLEVVLSLEQVRNFATKMYQHGFYLVFLTAFHVSTPVIHFTLLTTVLSSTSTKI